MTRSHDESFDLEVPSTGAARPRGGAPGKRTLTQGLAPRPIILRVASGQTVDAGADAALDRAAGSGGAPLRADLRDRFEASLGADLSAVRVHTGDASGAAAAAVGAHAYTVGNDIHFGAGAYQPDDPFGLHLIAHEVAHTQQQAGGTVERRHKPVVSEPGDAAEVEADRAADAMVAGRPAVVSMGPGVVQRRAGGGHLGSAPAPSDDDLAEARETLEAQRDRAGRRLYDTERELARTPSGERRTQLEAQRDKLRAEQHAAADHLGMLGDPDPRARTRAVDHAKRVKQQAEALEEATDIPSPDLDDLPSVRSGQGGSDDEDRGVHWKYDVKRGRYRKASGELEAGDVDDDEADNIVVFDGPSAKMGRGASAEAEIDYKEKDESEHGSMTFEMAAKARAYAGESAGLEVNQDGFEAKVAAGVGAEASAEVSRDVRSNELAIDGDTTVSAGFGAKAGVKAEVAAGLGAEAALKPDEQGVMVKAGAAATIEATAELHADLGPLTIKTEAGALAGAAAGVGGGIKYEGGVLTIEAGAYAALGFGETTETTVRIDLKKARAQGLAVLERARQAGLEGAEAAFAAADADGDGELTLNDPAQHAADYLNERAEELDRGVDGAIAAIDGDGDGRFSARDVEIRAAQGADRARRAVVDVDRQLDDAYARARAGVEDIQDRAGAFVDQKQAQLEEAGEQVRRAADWDGDGEVGLDDATAAGQDLLDAGSSLTRRGVDAATTRARQAADRDGDGEITTRDVVTGARQAVDRGREVIDDAEAAVDRADAAVREELRQTKQAVAATYQRARDAADLDGDGDVDSDDARLATQRAGKQLDELEGQAREQLGRARDRVAEKAGELKEEVHDRLDRDGDGTLGVDDAQRGAEEIIDGARDLADGAQRRARHLAGEAAEQFDRATDTLADGAERAADTAGRAIDKAARFAGVTDEPAQQAQGGAAAAAQAIQAQLAAQQQAAAKAEAERQAREAAAAKAEAVERSRVQAQARQVEHQQLLAVLTGTLKDVQHRADLSKGRCNALARRGERPNAAATRHYSDGMRIYNEAVALVGALTTAARSGATEDELRGRGMAARQRFEACIAAFAAGDQAQAAG